MTISSRLCLAILSVVLLGVGLWLSLCPRQRPWRRWIPPTAADAFAARADVQWAPADPRGDAILLIELTNKTPCPLQITMNEDLCQAHFTFLAPDGSQAHGMERVFHGLMVTGCVDIPGCIIAPHQTLRWRVPLSQMELWDDASDPMRTATSDVNATDRPEGKRRLTDAEAEAQEYDRVRISFPTLAIIPNSHTFAEGDSALTSEDIPLPIGVGHYLRSMLQDGK